MDTPHRSLAGFLVLTALMGGCAPRTTQTGIGGPPPTLVEVKNDRWENLTVYLQRDGQLQRLGRVWGLERAVLEVPAYHAGGGDVMLLAGANGAPPTVSSGYFQLERGDRIHWEIELNSAPIRVSRDPPDQP